MSLQIDMKPEIENRLKQEAARESLSPTELARRLIENSLLAPNAENQAAIELLRQWREEDQVMTEEENAAEEADWQAIQADLNATRKANGERLLFP